MKINKFSIRRALVIFAGSIALSFASHAQMLWDDAILVPASKNADGNWVSCPANQMKTPTAKPKL